jgi:hypothetical protein
MPQFDNLVIRKPIPLHMLTGYPTEDRLLFLAALLNAAPEKECVGIIQSLSPLENGQLLPSGHHPIESMETASCICCDVYVLFYGRLSRMLTHPDLTRVVVDLEPRAEPRAMLKMLMASPLGLQIIPQPTMLAWNETEGPMPEWVGKHEQRLWMDAGVILTRTSRSIFPSVERMQKLDKKFHLIEGSHREQAEGFWLHCIGTNDHSQPTHLSPMSLVLPKGKMSR